MTTWVTLPPDLRIFRIRKIEKLQPPDWQNFASLYTGWAKSRLTLCQRVKKRV